MRFKNEKFIAAFSGHNITFLNGFPADFHVDGLVEITPTNFVQYIQNYTNWDLLGEMSAFPWIFEFLFVFISLRPSHEELDACSVV